MTIVDGHSRSRWICLFFACLLVRLVPICSGYLVFQNACSCSSPRLKKKHPSHAAQFHRRVQQLQTSLRTHKPYFRITQPVAASSRQSTRRLVEIIDLSVQPWSPPVEPWWTLESRQVTITPRPRVSPGSGVYLCLFLLRARTLLDGGLDLLP